MNKKAYIAVGAGAAIIGAIWPAIVALFIAGSGIIVKVFWRPIRGFFIRGAKNE